MTSEPKHKIRNQIGRFIFESISSPELMSLFDNYKKYLSKPFFILDDYVR